MRVDRQQPNKGLFSPDHRQPAWWGPDLQVCIILLIILSMTEHHQHQDTVCVTGGM